MTDPEYRLFQSLPSVNPSATSNRADAGQAGDNDADIYDYDDIITDTSTSTANRTVDETGLVTESISLDNGEGTTVYDPETGAYDQMYDYTTGDGGYKHHRERLTDEGVYQSRDVDRRNDGTRHVHRKYQNPVTGTRTVRDYER
ncbi:hypothetical protein BJX66DRAFT_295420 [Aspergillus keveii]|uniref:Uncharacterized protein n=1 Tax=Aspergillus keveii TaxID=714993 RepID=A0ABR4GIB5_9EURO